MHAQGTLHIFLSQRSEQTLRRKVPLCGRVYSFCWAKLAADVYLQLSRPISKSNDSRYGFLMYTKHSPHSNRPCTTSTHSNVMWRALACTHTVSLTICYIQYIFAFGWAAGFRLFRSLDGLFSIHFAFKCVFSFGTCILCEKKIMRVCTRGSVDGVHYPKSLNQWNLFRKEKENEVINQHSESAIVEPRAWKVIVLA